MKRLTLLVLFGVLTGLIGWSATPAGAQNPTPNPGPERWVVEAANFSEFFTNPGAPSYGYTDVTVTIPTAQAWSLMVVPFSLGFNTTNLDAMCSNITFTVVSGSTPNYRFCPGQPLYPPAVNQTGTWPTAYTTAAGSGDITLRIEAASATYRFYLSYTHAQTATDILTLTDIGPGGGFPADPYSPSGTIAVGGNANPAFGFRFLDGGTSTLFGGGPRGHYSIDLVFTSAIDTADVIMGVVPGWIDLTNPSQPYAGGFGGSGAIPAGAGLDKAQHDAFCGGLTVESLSVENPVDVTDLGCPGGVYYNDGQNGGLVGTGNYQPPTWFVDDASVPPTPTNYGVVRIRSVLPFRLVVGVLSSATVNVQPTNAYRGLVPPAFGFAPLNAGWAVAPETAECGWEQGGRPEIVATECGGAGPAAFNGDGPGTTVLTASVAPDPGAWPWLLPVAVLAAGVAGLFTLRRRASG